MYVQINVWDPFEVLMMATAYTHSFPPKNAALAADRSCDLLNISGPLDEENRSTNWRLGGKCKECEGPPDCGPGICVYIGQFLFTYRSAGAKHLEDTFE